MADMWIALKARLVAASDADAVLRQWQTDRDISLTQLADLLSTSGTFDLAAAQSNVTLPMGDITTGQFLYLEADTNTASFNLDGDDYDIALRQRLGTNPAIAMLLTEFTSIRANAGASDTRITYFLAGV